MTHCGNLPNHKHRLYFLKRQQKGVIIYNKETPCFNLNLIDYKTSHTIKSDFFLFVFLKKIAFGHGQ